VQKDFDVMGKLPAYVRLDYQYKSPFYTGVGPQDVGYTPFSYQQSQTHFMTARAAVTKDNLEISLFVNNLTNSRDRLSHSQEGGSALFVDTTYRPREIGLELTYRH
jgi:iron complex outermembrane receptor protein